MTNHERETLRRVVKESILTMIRATLTSEPQVEVDGIVCVSSRDAEPIVIKVHELVKVDQHSRSLRLSHDTSGDAHSLLVRQLASRQKRPAPSPSLEGAGEEGVLRSAKRLRTTPPETCLPSSTSPSLEGDVPGRISSDEDARSFRLSPPSETFQSRQLPGADLPEDLSKTSPAETEGPSGVLDLGIRSPSSGGQPSVNGGGGGGFALKTEETSVPNADTDDVETSSGKGSPEGSGNMEECSSSNPNTPSALSNGSLDGSSGVKGEGDRVTCPKCQQPFENVETFITHNLRDHALFTCRICYRGFTARNNLKRHIRLHTGVKPFKCTLCNHAFSRKDDLKGHILRHSYSKPFRCSLCSKGYTDRSCVRNHMAKEHGVRLQHVCPQCGEGFSDTKKYTDHKRQHPEFRSFRCKHCNFTGVNALMYMKHMLIHEQRSFTCSPCNEVFQDPLEYTEHLKQHRGEEDFKSYACCFCSTVLGTHEQFIRHEYTHAQGKAHTCHLCLRVFRFPSSLKDHLEAHHNHSSSSSSNNNNYVVIKSNSSLGNNDSHSSVDDAFKIHVPDEFKERLKVLSSSVSTHTSPEKVGTQYYCTECQVGFESEDILQDHIVQAHERQQSQGEDEGDVAGDDSSMMPQDLSMPHKSSPLDESKAGFPTFQSSSSLLMKSPRSLLNGDSILKRTLQGAALVSPPPQASGSATIDLNQTKPMLLAKKRELSTTSTTSSTATAANGTDQIDLSQTKLPLLRLLEGRRESLRRVDGPRHEDRSQVQTATFSINGDALRIKKEVMSDEEDESSMGSFNPGSDDLIALHALQNGFTSHDSGKESPDGFRSDVTENGGDRPGDVTIERMHIRAPGFERVVTPDVLFRDRTSLSCQQCSAVFTDFASFETHSSEQHRRFVCEYCGKSFTAKPNRDRHVRYHTGVRPYRCQVCDMSFFRGDDLKYHRTTRHASVRS